jgi:hypothetical protein
MAESIYALCAAASVFCAVLLIRSYRRSGLRLVLLSCLCFSGLAVNNVLLFVDLVVAPDVDLSAARGVIAVGALLSLVIGLIGEEA